MEISALFKVHLEIRFWVFFEAEMTKIDILNQKLIVTNDYQQFLTHFEWFLSLLNF